MVSPVISSILWLGKRCHETLISKENSFRKKRKKEKHTFTSHTHVKYPYRGISNLAKFSEYVYQFNSNTVDHRYAHLT